jgi:hypothetical protein
MDMFVHLIIVIGSLTAAFAIGYSIGTLNTMRGYEGLLNRLFYKAKK